MPHYLCNGCCKSTDQAFDVEDLVMCDGCEKKYCVNCAPDGLLACDACNQGFCGSCAESMLDGCSTCPSLYCVPCGDLLLTPYNEYAYCPDCLKGIRKLAKDKEEDIANILAREVDEKVKVVDE